MKNIYYLLFSFIYYSDINEFYFDKQKGDVSFCVDEYSENQQDDRIAELNHFVGELKKYAGKSWEFDDLVVSLYIYLLNCNKIDKKEVSFVLWRIRGLIPEEGDKVKIQNFIREFAKFILK